MLWRLTLADVADYFNVLNATDFSRSRFVTGVLPSEADVTERRQAVALQGTARAPAEELSYIRSRDFCSMGRAGGFRYFLRRPLGESA